MIKYILAFALLLLGVELSNAQAPTKLCYPTNGSNCITVDANNPLPVDATATIEFPTIGAAVPSEGIYNGLNVAGTLRGWNGIATGALYSGAVAIVDASGNQITSFGSGDVNITAVGGNAVTTFVPVEDASVVTAISNAAIPTGTSSSPPTDLIAVATQPVVSGGLLNYFVQPAASDNHVTIKAGVGQVYYIHAFNNSATVNYLRLYNATSGFNGCNSATDIMGQWQIPANTAVGGFVLPFPGGLAFSTGISICITSGYATTDTTNATASAMSINVGYK